MKILLVGAGSIGQRHLTNLAQMKAGELSVCETDQDRLAQATKTLGIPGFSELNQALAQKPDAMIIATPTHLHTAIALKALQTVKNIFIEKPIADTLEQAEHLTAEANRRNAMVLVGCNMRFHPGVAAVKQVLEERRLRNPLLFRAWFSHYLPNWRPGADYRQTYSARSDQGGGIILECIHELDYLQWFAGKIIGVRSFAKHTSDLEIETEDYSLIMLDFESGATGEVRLDYLRHIKSRGCEVISPGDAFLYWASRGKNPEEVFVSYVGSDGIPREIFRNDSYNPNEMYLKEMQHFLDCILGKEKPLVDAETATEVLRVALAAKQKTAKLNHFTAKG